MGSMRSFCRTEVGQDTDPDNPAVLRCGCRAQLRDGRLNMSNKEGIVFLLENETLSDLVAYSQRFVISLDHQTWKH